MNDTQIHNSACVHEKACIGKGTKIWHHSQIMAHARIGDNCVIGHNCLITSKAVLGNGVKLQSNTDVYDGVVLENFVFIGPSVVFTNDIRPRAKYPKSQFPQYGQWLPTLVKEGASLGANATIMAGVTIGKWALVGAGAVVSRDVPDHALVRGVPAKMVGWVCECANTIVFEENTTVCAVCERRYTREGMKVSQI